MLLVFFDSAVGRAAAAPIWKIQSPKFSMGWQSSFSHAVHLKNVNNGSQLEDS